MKKLLAITGISVMLSTSLSFAEAPDPLIEGAKLCTRHLPRYEREYGIPTHLLSAIASTESGRYHEGLQIKIPWPWTINAEGKGFFFKSKEEAIAAAKKMRAQGIKSMDVGCMQVNIMHHSNAFASLEQAFEPQNNIAYAASFLRGLYNEGKSWKQAAADYHSKTPSRGSQYVSRVYSSWYNIIDKLRAAKLQVPGSTPSTATAPTQVASAQKSMVTSVQKYDASTQTLKEIPASKSVALLSEQKGKQLAAFQTPRMNSLQVGDKRGRVKENGIIVVRPDIKVVDSAAPSAGTSAVLTVAQVATTGEAKVVRLDNAVLKTSGNKKPGPNFVFDN